MLLLEECGNLHYFEPYCITFYLSISIFGVHMLIVSTEHSKNCIFIMVERLLCKVGVTFSTFSTKMVLTPGVMRCPLLKGYLTITPQVHVGYEMVDIQLGSTHLVGYDHLISNKHEWNYCFIKNAHKISRILPNYICKNNWFSACF